MEKIVVHEQTLVVY